MASRYLRHAIGGFVALTITRPILNIKKLCFRADGFEKLFPRTTVCVPQLSVKIKCKLMATLKLAIPKSGSPTKVAHGLYNCVSFSCRFTV